MCAGPTQWLWYGLVCLIFLFAALNHLFYGIASVTLERDWVVVIADEDQEWLRIITANLRQIDLCTDLVAPSLVSLLAMVSYEAVAIFIRQGHETNKACRSQTPLDHAPL